MISMARFSQSMLLQVALSGMLVVCGASVLTAQQPQVDFASQIRPLLSDRCFACHGPDAEHRQADLRADRLESLTEDRGGYKVVDVEAAESSELLRRIFSDDASEQMPPPEFNKPLSSAEQELLKRWIQQGAPWRKHWAYEPPRPQPMPAITEDQANPPENWIDGFVLAKLSAQGGQLSPPADRVTLARRLSFDLTGLPPKPAAIHKLLAEGQAGLQSYTDALLASPEFGERLATYWLDLVRYADTVGYHGDQDHNISPYRDYVIRAFNRNKPFDEFTIEQLAGDLLPSGGDDPLVASGYNRLLQTSHEGGVQVKEYLAIYAADRVRNISAVWMGATVGCAQCHDHKFDPFTAKDFYSLAAFFADVDETQHFTLGTNALPTRRPPEQEFLDPASQLLLEQLGRQRKQLDKQLQERLAESGAEGSGAGNSAVLEQLAAARERLDSREKSIRQSSRLSMITQAVEPRTVRVLPRGNWLDETGEIVTPAVPEILGSLPAEVSDRLATRLDLARWLVDAEQGAGLLTARVTVNRLWMLMLGRGLSRSVGDFGGQGESPTHPELLDQLAIEFVASGWDIKHMFRLIASSGTYRQASLETDWHREHDPENRLLSRQNRFRIPAEMVRDTALECGGLLVRQVGGASAKPYQPEGYYRHLNFPTRKYSSSTGAQQYRRGVYTHWQRQFLHPMLKAFDAPTREECTALRAQSNTPLAALVLLNDPSMVEAARGLAARTATQAAAAADAKRIGVMFEIATSRWPDEAETHSLQDLLSAARTAYALDSAAAAELLGSAPAQPGEGKPAAVVEAAAWTTVARAMLNMAQTYLRN